MGSVAIRLTKRVVDHALPGDKPVFIWDSELRGFGLRVEPTGTKTFVLRYRLRHLGASGPKRFLTVGRFGPLTADQAREQAKAILGAVSLGQDPAVQLATSKAEFTFAAAVELFLEDHVKRKRKASTERAYASMLRLYAIPSLGQKKLSAISKSDIAKLHSSMSEKPYQANRLVAVIGSLYSFAARRELVPESLNPARKADRFKEDRRERFLSLAELARVGSAIDEGETVGLPWKKQEGRPFSKHHAKPENRRTFLTAEVAAGLRLLIFTGARLREIMELRWDWVDLDRGLLLLPDSKTGRKTIVLNDAAQAVLSKIPRVARYVIPGKNPEKPRTDLRSPWNLVCSRAGLSGVRLHDLRHTFASFGAGASLGLPIVGKLLGHTQPQTTARYAHLDADPLRKASNIIGDQLHAALTGGSKAGSLDAHGG